MSLVGNLEEERASEKETTEEEGDRDKDTQSPFFLFFLFLKCASKEIERSEEFTILGPQYFDPPPCTPQGGQNTEVLG